MTFDELFKEHHLTSEERRELATYLATLRVRKTLTVIGYQQEEALNRYRYAAEWAAAESWDSTEEVRARFEWARALDPCGILSTDDLAHIGQDFLRHSTS